HVKIIIRSTYIPPGSTDEIYNSHCSNVEEIAENNHLMFLFGDYNLPPAYWRSADEDDSLDQARMLRRSLKITI
ncbi:hypothetical protein HHI36_018194, partial [Cryptolaemus montrouzieri]